MISVLFLLRIFFCWLIAETQIFIQLMVLRRKDFIFDKIDCVKFYLNKKMSSISAGHSYFIEKTLSELRFRLLRERDRETILLLLQDVCLRFQPGNLTFSQPLGD